MHLPACLLSVARAWSVETSRMLGILGWIARQGRQKAGDRERGLGEQGSRKKQLVFSVKWGANSPRDTRDTMAVGGQLLCEQGEGD